MQPQRSSEEGFSPLRVARAGRRAGRHAADAADHAGIASSNAPDTGAYNPLQPISQHNSIAVQQGDVPQPSGGPQHESETSSTTSLQQQSQAATGPNQSQHLQHQQQQQEPSTSVSTPPVKRVGFELHMADSSKNAGGAAAESMQHNFTGVSRRKQEQMQRDEQSQAKMRNKYDEKAVDALEDVTELQEAGKEDITRMVAQAPKATAAQVQALSELELNQGWIPPQAARNTDINLSMLSSCLLPSAQVVEPPDVWEYDLLFAQLKAELQTEERGDVSSAVAANGAGDLLLS